MAFPLVLALALTVATNQSPVAPGDSSCVAALDSMMVIFARDYAGYRDKVAGHEPALRVLTDSVRAVARTADDYRVCIPALQRITRFFWDPHVTGPWQGSPPSAAPTAAGPAPPSDDPQRPALTFVDESTVVVRLADLDVSYKARLDSLVTAAWPRLLATPYLVVDLRGNRGGCTCVTDTLRPLLYTGPIHITGQDILASPDNTAWLRDWYEANAAQFSAADRAGHAALISNMEAHPGAMVPFGRDTVITRDSGLSRPRRVAVLFDSACASSCEDFVLEARQSRKVLVLGSGHTKGVFDYGNARTVMLPGWRQVRFGTSRQRGEHYDHVGLEPDVRLPSDVADPIAYAVGRLRAGTHDRFIAATGARLHVVDWGGRGPLLLFLPGFGNGAHIFDSLAPAFTDRWHVAALTPRGFPPSSAPDSGYTIAQLAADVRVVVDSLGGGRVVLAGHSISGAVITRFAIAYPDRLLAAVYLDGAYDFGESYRRAHKPRAIRGPMESVDTTAESFRAWRRQYPDWDAVREQDSHMWQIDSADLARRQSLVAALANEVRTTPHEIGRVRAPALVVCPVGSFERGFGWLTPDSTRWRLAQQVARDIVAEKRAVCEDARRKLAHGHLLLLDSGHYVFLDQRDHVISAMRRFLEPLLR